MVTCTEYLPLSALGLQQSLGSIAPCRCKCILPVTTVLAGSTEKTISAFLSLLLPPFDSIGASCTTNRKNIQFYFTSITSRFE